MVMNKILIVEDNKDINNVLKEFLTNNNYNVASVFNGIDAVKIISETEFDLVLLDLMIPYKSGDTVLSEIRIFSNVPVIVISAKDLITTKIDILKLGADDYITKPLDLYELLARIDVVLKRYNIEVKATTTTLLTYKDLILNPNNQTVEINKNDFTLTFTEYNILKLLLTNKNKIFSKANLYESVWGEEYFGDDNLIKTHMSNLRSKLKKISNEDYIETVYSLGYRLYKE